MVSGLGSALWAAALIILPAVAGAQSLFRAEIASDGLADLDKGAFQAAQPLVAMGVAPVSQTSAAPLSEQGFRLPPPRGTLRPIQRDGIADAKELACLTEAIYFEARGESSRGQVAVAEVILNRVDSPRYPDTVCEVVNEGTGRLHACQFSYTCDGQPETITEQGAWNHAREIAYKMINGAPRVVSGNATHYHATYVDPHWARVYPQTAQVGTHIFYRYIPGA